MTGRLVAAVLEHPKLVLVAWALAILFAVFGATGLRVDFSSTAFYGTESESRQRYDAFVERWGPDDRTLAVVVQTDAFVLDDAVRERLAAVSRALADLDEVDRVVGPHELPTLLQGMLRQTAPGKAMVSANGKRGALIVELRDSTDDPRSAVTALDAIEQVLEQYRSPPTASLEPAGLPAIRAAFIALVVRDQLVLGPLTALAAGLILLAAWRRPRLVVAAGIGAGVPVILLLGVMGWSGEPVGLLNQAYFTLLPVIALADTVHLITDACRGARENPGASHAEVVTRAGRRVGWACLLTSVTTGLGFASLGATSLPMLQRFGLFAAIGIALAYAVVVMLVPLLLLWAKPTAQPDRGAGWAHNLARVCIEWPKLTIVAWVVLAAVAWFPAQRVVVDNHLSGLLQPDHPVRRASADLDRELGGTLSLELEIKTRDRPLPTRAELDAFRELALGHDAVGVVFDPWSIPGENPRFVDEPNGVTRVSVRVADVGGQAFAQLEDELLQTAASSFPDAQVTATGTTSLAYRGINRITSELRWSLAGLLAIVTVLIGGLLRSPSLALRSILPNVLPLWLGYAAVGLLAIELDPIATVVLALALGIAVDDTIHVTVRFVEMRREQPVKEAALAAVRESGSAVVLTSVCLALGLAANGLSSFPPLVVLGGLGSSLILLAMLADITLLPALLVVGSQPPPTPTPSPRTESESASAAAD